MYSRVFSGFQMEPFLEARNDPSLRASLGLSPDDFVIGKIGRLVPLKGHEDLLLAARGLMTKYPGTRLLLIGEGPLRSKLEARAGELGLTGKVVFTGLVPPGEVSR